MSNVHQMSSEELRAERQTKQTALYQGKVKPGEITATSKRVQEVDAELLRGGEPVF